MTSLTPALSQAVFKQCFGLKPQESVLIVTDKGKLKEAALLAQAAQLRTNKVQVLEFNTMTENAQEPPETVVKKMAAADVVLLVTTYSLSHTQAREKSCLAGARIASLPGITVDMIARTLTIDYQTVADLSQKVARALTQGSQVKIVSPGGTKLELSISGRR